MSQIGVFIYSIKLQNLFYIVVCDSEIEIVEYRAQNNLKRLASLHFILEAILRSSAFIAAVSGLIDAVTGAFHREGTSFQEEVTNSLQLLFITINFIISTNGHVFLAFINGFQNTVV